MIHAPHPALRRLFALGGAPGQALSALEAGRAVLDALSCDLDALPLLSDAPVAALAAALDLSPLAAALGGMPGPGADQECAGVPGGAWRAGSPGLPSTAEVPRSPVPSSSPVPQGRAATVRGVPAATPAPPLHAPGGITERMVDQVQGLLERYAPEGHGRPSGTASRESPPRPRSADPPGTPRDRAAGGASGEVRGEAAVPEPDADRRPTQPRPPSDSEPGLRARARRAEEAAGLLARRAARAGSPEAATTPVGAVPAPPEMDAVLVEGASEVPKAGVPLAKRPEAIPGGSTERLETAQLGGLSRMAQAVARLERRASLAAGASAPPAVARPAGSGPETPPAPRREAPRESPGGLRGLLRRVGPPAAVDGTPAGRPEPPREPFPDPLAGCMPREAGPGLLAERMEDALLADRLAAVLRREAMCQGIDLERVD